ncbi:MAG TPA: glycosyltransferase family 4 protein [Candidatus Binatia bacterium]|jgi:glycosyltransferase involved in cell wall biosynthesis
MRSRSSLAGDQIAPAAGARDRAVIGTAAVKPAIALVAGSLDIVGGQEVQASALCERFRHKGYGVAFVPINPRFPCAARWLRRVPYLRTVVNEALYIPTLARLRKADVVHVFSASYWSFLLAPAPAMLAAKIMGKRVVLNYHSGEAADHLSRWGILVHPFLKLADEIVVPSQYLKEVFARHGYRARVIRNVVDTSSFRFRERKPLRPRLLSTRNLEPIYRVDNTLRAFALLRARHPEATLTIAGCGSEEQRLRRQAVPFAGSVRFVGRVAPASMPRIYDEADIFVNSSIVDNQPLSVLEAFAAGLPVVSTPTGELAAMVREGDTGSIVSAENPEAMAAAIARLLTEADGALAMARRARVEVENYTWQAVHQEWLAAYSGRRA